MGSGDTCRPVDNSLAQRSYEVALDGQIAADDRFVWIADELGESVWQLDAGNWRVMRSIQVGSLPSDVTIGFGSVGSLVETGPLPASTPPRGASSPSSVPALPPEESQRATAPSG